ncbi:MAG: ABC transporter substrate-binding protein [Candidatus Aureabacteria bacterium]|nr:ABC transporter substrate-binding protein [Candidatus Auribacterota bacterium]
MRRALVVLSILVGISIVPAMAQGPTPTAKGSERTLRFVSDFDSSPFSYIRTGKKTGFEYDLGEAIGKELGVKVVWVKKAFSPAAYAAMLNTGSVDAAMSSISITPERERLYMFTLPYYRSNLAVAAIRDYDWNHTDFVNGLKDMQIGVLRRSTSYEWARRNLSAKRINYYSPERLAQALRDEQILCILIDEDILKWALKDNAYRFQEVERDLDHEYYGIAVKKGNLALADELNGAMKRLDEKDIYDALYDKWFTHRINLPVKTSR